MRRWAVAFVLLGVASAAGAQQSAKRVVISGSNDQSVTVSGSINNKAESGAQARINVGAVSNASVGSNRQSVHVSGSIQNQAAGSGSKATVNIGSVSDDH
ncbi:MAG TPA: hypothetical protein VIG88_06565 [Lysobacter sp.]